MRKKRWIAPVWGMLAAAAFGQTATAQNPGSPLDGPFPPVPGSGPYAGAPTFTPIVPDPGSPAGFPPEMQPWPTISPFDHAVDTTYNDRGIWFREMLNHKRKYHVDAEFISARFRQPGHATVGHAAAIQSFDASLNNGTGSGGIDPFDIFTVKDAMVISGKGRYISPDAEFDYPDPPGAQFGDIPRSINFALEVTEVNVDQDDSFFLDFTFPENKAGLLQIVNINDSGEPDAVPDADAIAKTVLYPVTGQVFGDEAVTRFGGTPDVVGEKRENPASPGLRMVFGLEDEDGSGFDWTGYWVGGQDTVFRRGLDDPNRPRLTNIVFFDAPWLGQDAVEVLDYNTLFQLEHETETAGTDLAFYTTPMVDFGWFRMRPMWGARYDYIRESFRFHGKDNGIAYTWDTDGDNIGGGGDDDGGSVRASNLVPNTLEEVNDVFIFNFVNPYETTVNSRVRSHLYGPQIGFDMQAGGEHLMLTAVTKTGLLANTEKLSLDTEGFGSTEAISGVRPFHSDAKTHTRVAPFLEFKATADINVFPVIPVVNRWQFLKNARVRTGWTTLVVGNLQRPMDQIVWRSDASGGPHIKESGRDHWYMQYWDVGVHWSF